MIPIKVIPVVSDEILQSVRVDQRLTAFRRDDCFCIHASGQSDSVSLPLLIHASGQSDSVSLPLLIHASGQSDSVSLPLLDEILQSVRSDRRFTAYKRDCLFVHLMLLAYAK